jgi:hypothetical protein
MRPKRTFTEDELRKIRSLYQSGVSLSNIGKEFEISKNVIKKAVVDMGVFQSNRTTMSVDEHKKRIKVLGRVELVGNYTNTMTKTMYRCLLHGEEHLAYPGNILKGFGLKCCLREGSLAYNYDKSRRSADLYDERVREITDGMIIRIGEYISANTPIEHLCRKHDEVHLSRPQNILTGYGLRCCRVAWSRQEGAIRNKSAKDSYDIKLRDRSDGRFQRVDEYISATDPILHYCTTHGEEHLAIPNKLLNGEGMKCCNTGVGWDTLENLLEHKPVNYESDLSDPCQFYIFQVPYTNDCVKVGIAKSALRRSRVPSSKDLYGDLVSVWQCSSRRNAILIETSVLRDPSFEHPTSLVDSLVYKAGQSEVRRVDIDDLVAHVQDLFDSLEQDGTRWQSWALEKIPTLRLWEQKVLSGLSD